MTKVICVVGYSETVEGAPGVFDDVITEKTYSGDFLRLSRKASEGQGLVDDISLTNSVSIVADAFTMAKFMSMKYVLWNGVYWSVSTVEVAHPRLTIRLGGVYNGPTA